MFIQKKLNPFSSTKTSDEKIIKYESYPYLNYRLIPNQSTKTTNINRLGFRGEEIDEKKDSILLFGNSTLYGSGLRDNELISYYLGEMYEECNVINTGMSGFTIKEELLLLLEIFPKIKRIKHIIFLDGFPDIYSSFVNRKIGYSPYFYEREREKKCLESTYSRILCKLNLIDKDNLNFPLPRVEDVVENYFINMEYISSILERKKIPFTFIIQPSLYCVINNKDDISDPILRQKSNNFLKMFDGFFEYFIDAYEVFNKRIDLSTKEIIFLGDFFDKKLSEYYLDHVHYSSKANTKLAKLIATKIVNK
jgi:lysophospholipase L1-like esterase